MKASRLLSLDGSDWRVVLSAGFLIPAYWLGVRSGLYRPASWPLQPIPDNGSQFERRAAVRMGVLVNATARRMPLQVTCLVRSLVLVKLLQRRTIQSRLRIGVRTVQGKFEAHAWVEHGGVPVNDHSCIADEFHPIDAAVPVQSFSSS